MKTKKKKTIFSIIIVLLIVIAGVYFVIDYSNDSVLSSKDKNWIKQNSGEVIDVAVINDIPLYGNDGNGVIFDFLTFFEEETGLKINKIPYLKDSKPSSADYKVEIIDGANELNSKQLLIYNDEFILLSKNKTKVDSIDDLNGRTLGVLSSESTLISYYLKSVSKVLYKTYSTTDALLKALDNNEVNGIIIPNIMYLDNSITGNYQINYFFTDISKNVVFTLNDNNEELNGIFSKVFNYWFDKEYVSDYNNLLLNYYIEQNKINDKTKADLLSKTYVYGYVDNAPYEFRSSGTMAGIAIEYLKRIVRLTNIDITYQKYASIDDLKKAIDNGDVDIYFDYINYPSDKYFKTRSVFIEKYVILGESDQSDIITTLESLKGKNINVLSNSYLLEFIKANSMANPIEANSIDDLTNNDNNLIIIDKELYNYYRNSKFSDYVVLKEDYMTNDYTFLIKSDNESFYNLFDYIINTNSYYNYRNSAYESFGETIFDRASFEELYLLILGMVLIPIILIVIIVFLYKNRRKITILKREDRKKYTDMLTSLKNRNYLNLNIEKWNNNKVYPQSLIVIDLNNVKYVNDNYGREKGDMLIVSAASILVNTQLENTEIIRSDGNEFLIYMLGYTENQVDVYVKKLSQSLKDLPYGFGAAIGYSMIVDNIKTIDDAINEATIEMENDKENYK